MKIGVFDSGLGGLVIAQSIRQHLPTYDYVYFGDTLNVPYGGKSKQAVYSHTEKAIDYLIHQKQCALIILACNTATAHCARLLQQFYLVRSCPQNRILGVVIPTLESCIEQSCKNIGMLATAGMIESMIYQEELTKLDPDISFHGIASPLLVPMIENEGQQWIGPALDHYLNPIIKHNVDSLILGCTHYPLLKQEIQKRMGSQVKLISQDEIIPKKLDDYLRRHKEMASRLSQNGTIEYIVSDITKSYRQNASILIGEDIDLEKPLSW